jgi:hypothetical protein
MVFGMCILGVLGQARTDIHVSIQSLFGRAAVFQGSRERAGILNGLKARRRPPLVTASLFSGNPGVESGIPALSIRICRRFLNRGGSCREEIP